MHPVSFYGFNDLGILFLPKGIRKCFCSSVHNNVMNRVENVNAHYVKSIAHDIKHYIILCNSFAKPLNKDQI